MTHPPINCCLAMAMIELPRVLQVQCHHRVFELIRSPMLSVSYEIARSYPLPRGVNYIVVDEVLGPLPPFECYPHYWPLSLMTFYFRLLSPSSPTTMRPPPISMGACILWCYLTLCPLAPALGWRDSATSLHCCRQEGGCGLGCRCSALTIHHGVVIEMVLREVDRWWIATVTQDRRVKHDLDRFGPLTRVVPVILYGTSCNVLCWVACQVIFSSWLWLYLIVWRGPCGERLQVGSMLNFSLDIARVRKRLQ